MKKIRASPGLWMSRSEAAAMLDVSVRRLHYWEATYRPPPNQFNWARATFVRTRRDGRQTLVCRADVVRLRDTTKRVVAGLLAARPIVDILREQNVTLDEVEHIRDDAVRRGEVIVIEKEDADCLKALLGLGPGASFVDILMTLRARVATYRRLRGLPAVRLVPPEEKPN